MEEAEQSSTPKTPSAIHLLWFNQLTTFVLVVVIVVVVVLSGSGGGGGGGYELMQMAGELSLGVSYFMEPQQVAATWLPLLSGITTASSVN